MKSIEMLYLDVFPDEDLLPLVRDLLQDAAIALSLVGIDGTSLAGHVTLTRCSVDGCDSKVALLGPLAVASASQRKGVGSAMVRDGLQRLENDDIAYVYVLGDPRYYRRFGFVPEAGVAPPYPLPAEWRGAWQSIGLGKLHAPCQGVLSTPQPWLRPALWTP